jgi:DNA polymerase-3 subunit gamma/tau
LEQNPAHALRAIAAVQDCGSDLRQFCSELMEHIRNILVAKMVPDADDLIELAPEELAETKADAARLTVEQVQEIFRVFHQAEEGLRNSQHPWFLLEMAAVRASRLVIETPGTSSGKTTAGPTQAGAAPQSRPAPNNKNSTSAPTPSGSARPPAREGKGPSALQNVPAIAPSQSPDAPGRVPGPRSESAQAEACLNEKPVTGNGVWELNWEAVVDSVHRDRPNIGAFLEETALVGIEHDIVTIGYPTSAGASMKMILKEDYQRMILEACQAVAGRPVRLRVVTLPPAGSTTTVAHRRRQREEVTEQRLRQEVLANPVVQEALSVFSGEIKEVRSKQVSSTESMAAGKTTGVMPG